MLHALHRAAGQAGAGRGTEIRDELGVSASREAVRTGVCRARASHGYESRVHGNVIELASCPFHALAREHTTLVCGMNLALLEALAERAAQGRLAVRDARAYRRAVSSTRETVMSEPSSGAIDRWVNEGGYDLTDHSRVDLVARIAASDQPEPAVPWPGTPRWPSSGPQEVVDHV